MPRKPETREGQAVKCLGWEVLSTCWVPARTSRGRVAARSPTPPRVARLEWSRVVAARRAHRKLLIHPANPGYALLTAR